MSASARVFERSAPSVIVGTTVRALDAPEDICEISNPRKINGTRPLDTPEMSMHMGSNPTVTASFTPDQPRFLRG